MIPNSDIGGYVTKQPIRLYYRDAIDCVESLFGNPLFTKCMEYTPKRVYQTAERLIRVFHEWLTGDSAWRLQVSTNLNAGILLETYVQVGETPSRCHPFGYHTLLGQNYYLYHDG